VWPDREREGTLVVVASQLARVVGHLVFHTALGLHGLHAFRADGVMAGGFGAKAR
jgi:hypothetical protein